MIADIESQFTAEIIMSIIVIFIMIGYTIMNLIEDQIAFRHSLKENK